MNHAILLCLALAVACATPPRATTVAPGTTSPAVDSYGALREVMHGGQTGPTVELAAVTARPHAFAVGALSGLRGEVTIVDGSIWLAVGDAATKTAAVEQVSTTTETATLLVVSHVEHWRSVALPGPIADADLDRAVETAARGAGVDVTKPFAFQLRGTGTVAWHVLAGTPAHGDHSRGAITGVVEHAPVHLVGFFATDAAGVYTHMGQHTHLHLVDEAAPIAGHADRVELAAGGTLLVPATAR
jgi:acetolactate decarboxylase